MRLRAISGVCWMAASAILFCLSLLTPSLQAQTAALAPYGRCPAPTREGVNVCAPIQNSEINAPFQVIAAGTSGRGQVAYMELWAAGKKITEVHRSPFDEAITLPPGPHTLTVIEVDDTGYYSKSAPVHVQVNEIEEVQCPVPSLPGVNVCSPPPNSCNTSPWTTFAAAARGASGTVARMELWVGKDKIANFPSDHLLTHLVLYRLSTR